MTTNINTWSDLVTSLEYVIDTDDIAAISDADRGESLRMLSDRGVKIENIRPGVDSFSWNTRSLVIETNGEWASIRKMTEEDFEELVFSQWAECD